MDWQRWRDAKREWVDDTLTTLRDWPWWDTAHTLRARFGEDRLGVTASSLTFTSLMAMVPLLTVMLALFTAFPVFNTFRDALQRHFLEALVPQGIARPVMGALAQFAAQATKLGSLGLVVLVVTALALMLTIDRTLNGIWRVRQPRPMAQRVLVYWAALTLGPLLLGGSLSITSYALTAPASWVGAPSGAVKWALQGLEVALTMAALASLFRYVPNTYVRWSHALAGALFAALGFELAKHLLGWYLKSVGTFTTIYGAFAAVPIFLFWVYLCWVIVLLGAVVAAYAPSLQARVVRHDPHAGHAFALALAVLSQLAGARDGERGLSLLALAARLRTDPLQLEPVVDELVAMDWLGRLEEQGEQRLVLLVDPATQAGAPLVDALLLTPRGQRTQAFAAHLNAARTPLAAWLAPPEAT